MHLRLNIKKKHKPHQQLEQQVERRLQQEISEHEETLEHEILKLILDKKNLESLDSTSEQEFQHGEIYMFLMMNNIFIPNMKSDKV